MPEIAESEDGESNNGENLSQTPSKSSNKSRKRTTNRRRGRAILVVLVLLALALVGGYWWVNSPPSATHRLQIVIIPRGTHTTGIGRLLEREGVIRSAYAFIVQTKLTRTGSVRAGRYRFYTDMGLREVIDTLARGPQKQGGEQTVTIPEGYTLRQIADLLETKGVTDGKAFYKLATDARTIRDLRIAAPWFQSLQRQKPALKTLEGYLFPDTYEFQPHITPLKALETLVTNFGNRFVRPYQQDVDTGPQGQTHNLHEIVTIASLIEREAEIEADRARIAGVIENRLQRHQKLQIDATVLYALGHHKNRLLYKDLKVRSPYNTYAHAGLPPGPIANPGLPSLIAALHPEKHDYLYYVARPTGAHIFTRTPAEHAAAIKQVLAERKRNNRSDQ